MSNEAFFLGGSKPLAKEKFVTEDGEIGGPSYPFLKPVTSYTESVESIDELRSCCIDHSKKGNCLLKGKLSKNLVNESRSGHIDKHSPTFYAVFDIDGIDIDPAIFLQEIGLSGYPYFYQYSASSGIALASDPTQYSLDRYHIFLWLESPMEPRRMKDYFKYLNLTHPLLKKHLSLNKTKQSLSWPLDYSVCDNSKLIYIAPPICHEGVIDVLTDSRFSEVLES